MEKIGIIDLGSNSARLVLVNVLDGGYFVIFDELKETVRLGEDMERDGFLKPARVSQAVKTLKMFRKLCDANKITKIIAVGTNAVRRAKNQKGFLEEVSMSCGFKINVLSAEEEAAFIYQGVINSIDIPKGVIVDISGSSTQIIHYNRRNIINHETLPFGAITLTSLFSDPELSPEEQAAKIEEYVLDQIKTFTWIKQLDPDVHFIGVGGSFRNLGKISRRVRRYPLDMAHNYSLTRDDFENVFNMVRVLDVDKRRKIKGISQGRADIFAASLTFMNAFFKFGNFPNVVISGCGLREGLMFNYAVPGTAEKPISDVVGYSLNTLVYYFDENRAHAEHVYNLSMQLFKQLRVLHKLPRGYIKVLRVASILHDAGMRIKFYDHHKHSQYVILNSNLLGISHRDIVLASFVAYLHRNDEIAPADWQRFRGIVQDEDLAAVIKLGVMLRIAESLDRSMSGSVKSLACDVLGDSVIMKTEVDGDCSLEIRDAMTVAPEFARAFHKSLDIL